MDLQQPQQPQQSDAHGFYQGNGFYGGNNVLPQLNVGASDSQSQAPATDPSAAPQDSGNFLTHLLPTITSIGGGLLGTLADPFTLGLGTVAGGAAGSALGKSWENALEGKDTTAGDLLSSAGEGALGGAIGKGLEGAAGLAGTALKGFGAKGVQAAADARQATADAEQAANAIAKAKNTAALYGKNAAEGTDQDFMRAQDFTNSLGHDISTNPAAAHTDVNSMIDALGNARKEALTNAGTVNTAGIIDANGNVVSPSIHDILMGSFNHTTPSGTSIDLSQQLGGLGAKAGALGDNSSSRFVASLAPGTAKTDATSLLRDVKVATAPLFKNGGFDSAGSVPGTAVQDSLTNVNNLLDSAHNELKLARSDPSTAAKVPALQAKVSYLSNVKSGIQNMLYNRPEFAEALGNATSREGGLLDTLNSMGDAGQKLASRLGEVNPTTGGQDYNKVFSDLLNARNVLEPAASKFSSPTSQFAQNEAGNTIQIAKNGSLGPNIEVDAQGNPIVDMAANHSHPVINGIGKVAQSLNNGGLGSQMAIKTGNLLQRLAAPASDAGKAAEGSSLVALPVAAGAVIGNSPNFAPGATPAGMYQTGQQPQGGTMQPGQPQPSQLSDLVHYIMLNPTTAGNFSGVLQAAAGQQLKQRQAESVLNSLENSYANAGGGQGMLGGMLSKLGGNLTGGNVAAYEKERQQAQQILGSLGVPMNAIPDVTSTAPAAQQQFGNAQNILGSLY